MNAVAAGLGADVNNGIAFTGGLGVENLIAPDQSQGESIHQRIARIASLELGFSAEVGDPEAIAIESDSTDYAFQDGMVFMNFLVRSGRERRARAGGRGRPLHTIMS